MPYPVMIETVLPPVRRRRFRRPVRDPGDVPVARLGSTYVFAADGIHLGYGPRPLDLADPVVVAATEVSLVQLRPQRVVVELGLLTRAGQQLVVESVFQCRVTDPVAVARVGLVDITGRLAGHLMGDAEASVGVFADVGAVVADVEALRRKSEARVRAYCAVSPPEIEGVEVILAGVHVITQDGPVLAPAFTATAGGWG